MKITKEKVIPCKIDLNSEELDIVVDFRLLLERTIRILKENGMDHVGQMELSFIETLEQATERFYNNVGVDYCVDVSARRADNGQTT